MRRQQLRLVWKTAKLAKYLRAVISQNGQKQLVGYKSSKFVFHRAFNPSKETLHLQVARCKSRQNAIGSVSLILDHI